MQNITGEELLAQYQQGKRDFRGVILQYTSLDIAKLEGVDFTGAIFNNVSLQLTFINCNFFCSEWWFCRIPKFMGCNMQYAVFEGCYFSGISVDSDWKNSQTMSPYHDEFIYERCDLRGMRKSSGGIYLGPEDYCTPGFGVLYKNTFDEDGFFHSGICCTFTLRDPNDDIPF